jgi:AraC-like DNA-binding protein
MKKANSRIRKIWVYLRLSYASGRDILYGISRYARTNAHWNIRLLPFSGEEGKLPFPLPKEADGIITSEPLAADVARHLRVSRRLCDLRFRECYGDSILEAILKIRFNELKRRLVSSNIRIGKITSACGFTCESHAKRAFKKRFGMSMREWRKSKGIKC